MESKVIHSTGYEHSFPVVLEWVRLAEAPVTAGVPQGSMLGHLLFLLFINDLPQNIQSQVHVMLFANDQLSTLQL